MSSSEGSEAPQHTHSEWSDVACSRHFLSSFASSGRQRSEAALHRHVCTMYVHNTHTHTHTHTTEKPAWTVQRTVRVKTWSQHKQFNR